MMYFAALLIFGSLVEFTTAARIVRSIQCSPLVCIPPCKPAYIDGASCPYCSCQDDTPEVQCSPPKCDNPGCYIERSTKPCPSCICSKPQQCGPTRCDAGCYLDYSTQPCPSCQCNNRAAEKCGPLSCSPGCFLDYSTEPCNTCKCNNAVPYQGSGSMASAHANSNSQRRGYYRR